MRRLLITLLCGLLVVPAALAASRATGDGVLELRTVNGTVSLGTFAQPAQGTAWGQMDKGTLRVADPVAGTGTILVSGWENRHLVPATDTAPKVVVYSGHDLHFRVTGGKYKLFFSGSGIDLTAVGVGVAYLAGDPSADDAGDYALNGGKWIPMPVTIPLQLARVPFGDQTPTQGP
jgi:hypothetical protein